VRGSPERWSSGPIKCCHSTGRYSTSRRTATPSAIVGSRSVARPTSSTRQLHSPKEGQVVWTHIETAHLTMRQFSPESWADTLLPPVRTSSQSAPISSTGLAYSFSIALKVTLKKDMKIP